MKKYGIKDYNDVSNVRIDPGVLKKYREKPVKEPTQFEREISSSSNTDFFDHHAEVIA